LKDAQDYVDLERNAIGGFDDKKREWSLKRTGEKELYKRDVRNRKEGIMLQIVYVRLKILE